MIIKMDLDAEDVFVIIMVALMLFACVLVMAILLMLKELNIIGI